MRWSPTPGARIAAVRRSRGARGDVRRTADPVDEELAGFMPPEPGHKDWLGVDLPPDV